MGDNPSSNSVHLEGLGRSPLMDIIVLPKPIKKNQSIRMAVINAYNRRKKEIKKYPFVVEHNSNW